MTRRTRQVLLALTVTTALCADPVAVAAPSVRPQVAGLAGQIVNRLTRSFRQTVTIELPVHAQQRYTGVSEPAAPALDRSAEVIHTELSPFQFRLPPPVL